MSISGPLVSCIMPTCDRVAFVPLAIASFLRQDYPERELVILDDGAEPVKHVVPDDPRIRYRRLPDRVVLGTKRNLACQEACGDVLLHWDDDDWYADGRISTQVGTLITTGADACGVRTLLFHDPLAGQAWRYQYPDRGRPWVAGSSLAYTRTFWERNEFAAIPKGEDTRFLWRGGSRRIIALDEPALVVATLHGGNTSSRTSRDNTLGSRWRPVALDEVVAVMGPEIEAYRLAAVDHARSRSASRARPAATAEPLASEPLAPERSSVLIGVVATVDPAALLATLRSIERNTGPNHQVVLLPDGPAPDMLGVLADLDHIPQLGSSTPLGGAACLNRLATHSAADILVLLEGGALVAPGWLDRMLHAFDSDMRCGVAGPSTNRAWNEQCIMPTSDGTQAGLDQSAVRLQRRFGTSATTLRPLLSLADFCYAIRRETLQDVGGADEGYGLGGRWEMDLNARAACAGWSGLWVKAAFVHRGPLTARRHLEEAEHGRASSLRYRSRFCAGCPRADQLSGHCAGEACDAFAKFLRCDLDPEETPAVRPSASTITPTRAPVVSCIMPTADRVPLALQAIEYFRRQDQPGAELIIVDDGVPGLSDLLPDDPRITYRHLRDRLSIGAKRNLACDLARADLLAQWDDDDWYSPRRLGRQLRPILADCADVTGLTGCLFLDVRTSVLFAVSPDAHREMFAHDIVGGTLVYRRSLLRSASYPQRSLAEDAQFLHQVLRGGARLVKVPNDDTFVYVRHGANSWNFEPGRHLGAQHWSPVQRTVMAPDDLAVYARFAAQRHWRPAANGSGDDGHDQQTVR